MKENSIEKDIKVLENLLDEGFEAMCYEEAQAIEHILSDYKKIQEEFKQVDHECERLEKREEILNKYKLALFMVIRNSTVMPQGIKIKQKRLMRREKVKENKIEIATDIDYGTISLRKRGKSIIKIGNERLGGTDVEIEVSTKFNWLQKKLWKYLLNIDIEDIKEDE